MSAFAHLCLNCVTREVSGEFSDENGEGFCSAECYHAANTEAVDAVDRPKCSECGDYADTHHPADGSPMCRGCWTHEDDDYYWDAHTVN